MRGTADYQYFVKVSPYDGKPHMYLSRNPTYFTSVDDGVCHENTYQGGSVIFDDSVFDDWLQKPTEITDTFEMFGRRWIIVDMVWGWGVVKAFEESPVTHLLAIYNLTELARKYVYWKLLKARLPHDLSPL